MENNSVKVAAQFGARHSGQELDKQPPPTTVVIPVILALSDKSNDQICSTPGSAIGQNPANSVRTAVRRLSKGHKIGCQASRRNSRLPPLAPEINGLAIEKEQTVYIRRIEQLERNLVFVKDHNQLILRSLHQEVEDLKIINRDLQYKLIVGQSQATKCTEHGTGDSKTLISMQFVKAALPREVTEHIEHLELETRRLRHALVETLKANARLQDSTSCRILRASSSTNPVRSSPSSTKALASNHLLSPSPQFDDFVSTWSELQTVSSVDITRSKRSKNYSQSTGQFLPPIEK